VRLFVAVEVPASVREAVAEAVAPLRSAAPRLRWVAPERYHLTVAFLGAVDQFRLPALHGALAQAAAGVAPFDLALDGSLGTFGRRVLWAGLAASPALADLAARVRPAVAAVVPLPDADRAFSAHLTLARAGREPVRPGVVADCRLPPMGWTVDRVVLLQSAGGYSVVTAVALADTDA
jgi:2'-5' RNA ligase